MRTTISVAVTPREAEKTKQLARKHGFKTTSDYLRFLMAEDDVSFISEDEVLRRGREVEHLARTGALIKGKRMRDFVST